MVERDRLLQSIATIVADYRAGEIPAPTAAHVDHWVGQFPQEAQQPILAEMEHILSRSYFSKEFVRQFLANLVINKDLVGDDPRTFWQGVSFLRLQTVGNSQRDFLSIFSDALFSTCGLRIEDCGANPHSYLYLDDFVFSGGRVGSDLSDWIKQSAPHRARVIVMVIAYHRLGQWFAGKDIKAAATSVGKSIDVDWWRAFEIEDRKAYMKDSDVLRPTHIPIDEPTQAYVNSLGQDPILRIPGQVGALGLFSSDEGKILLEQEFLTGGVKVRTICPNLGIYQRPLGNILLRIVGFGSMVVTYRNCPNNAPLVLWAGNPWYPLFPRKTN
ncbi:MAG TPA: hypothetical protein VGO55_13980 [Allosphingosinicella sp.]|jgi:hypothetical protein|nr:hypothetical protein [Allosphingosinicella sp.]